MQTNTIQPKLALTTDDKHTFHLIQFKANQYTSSCSFLTCKYYKWGGSPLTPAYLYCMLRLPAMFMASIFKDR